MPFEGRLMGAFVKRAEQLKKWQESETNKTSAEVPSHRPSRIKFPDGCVFLAACAASDKEEVRRLLDQGAEVNTTNVDGLTALHQACIDENLEMVKFLIEEGADINRHDNEGWTPLHASVSSGCVPIAEFLIKNGANVAAVNNDGELPIDLAECEAMEDLLQKEIDRLNIDCDAVRTQEEKIMLEDAMKWLNNKELEDNIHTKTGATALHVAAAKGYVKVMSVLIEAGADLNAQDYDGWTPFHAAAHWGQREACEILAEKLANMSIQNHVGQTCFDVSDGEMVKFLEELRSKQEMMERDRPEIKEILQRKPRFQPMRKTSINRMTSAEKITFMAKDKPAEREAIQATFAAITEKEPPKVNRIILEPEKEIIAKVVAKEVTAEPERKKFIGQDHKEPDIEPWKTQRQPVVTIVPPPIQEKGKVKEQDIIINERNDKDYLSPEMNEEEAIDSSIIKSTVPPVSDERAETQRKTSARRARETRRPTQGVTSEELRLAQRLILQKLSQKQGHEDEKESEDEEEEEEEEEETTKDDKYGNRYSSASSLSDSRVGSTSSLASSTEDADNKNYRKLYFDEKEENDKLRGELKKKESELEKTKEQLRKALQNNTKNDTEKKERRALERKLSELEEEVKSLSKIKNENEKLKAENRALTRTVSKLSKKS